MIAPRRWYRLAGLGMVLVALVLCVWLKAPSEAYFPLGLLGTAFFGTQMVKDFGQKSTGNIHKSSHTS